MINVFSPFENLINEFQTAFHLPPLYTLPLLSHSRPGRLKSPPYGRAEGFFGIKQKAFDAKKEKERAIDINAHTELVSTVASSSRSFLKDAVGTRHVARRGLLSRANTWSTSCYLTGFSL